MYREKYKEQVKLAVEFSSIHQLGQFAATIINLLCTKIKTTYVKNRVLLISTQSVLFSIKDEPPILLCNRPDQQVKTTVVSIFYSKN